MLFPNPFSEFDTKENKIKCEIQQGDKKSKTPYKMQIFNLVDSKHIITFGLNRVFNKPHKSDIKTFMLL